MRSSAVILRWNLAGSSFGTDESTSVPLANSIFPRWRIAATTLKIASWERERERRGVLFETSVFLRFHVRKKLGRGYLLLSAYSNNIHSSPCGKIIMGITYTNQFVATWLVKIVKWFRICQLVLLNFLSTLTNISPKSYEKKSAFQQDLTSCGAAQRR